MPGSALGFEEAKTNFKRITEGVDRTRKQAELKDEIEKEKKKLVFFVFFCIPFFVFVCVCVFILITFIFYSFYPCFLFSFLFPFLGLTILGKEIVWLFGVARHILFCELLPWSAENIHKYNTRICTYLYNSEMVKRRIAIVEK